MRQTSENSSFGSIGQTEESDVSPNFRIADLTVGRSDLAHLAEDQFGGLADLADQYRREDHGLRAQRLG